MAEPLTSLIQYGGLGVVLVIAFMALRVLYNDRNAEAAARIKDAQDNLQLVTKMQRELLDAVDKLTDLMVALQQERREERARHGGE